MPEDTRVNTEDLVPVIFLSASPAERLYMILPEIMAAMNLGFIKVRAGMPVSGGPTVMVPQIYETESTREELESNGFHVYDDPKQEPTLPKPPGPSDPDEPEKGFLSQLHPARKKMVHLPRADKVNVMAGGQALLVREGSIVGIVFPTGTYMTFYSQKELKQMAGAKESKQ